MIIISLLSLIACSGGETLGVVDGKEITMGGFKDKLVEEFGFEKKDLSKSELRGIFRDYYSSYVFFKEGEKENFYQKEDVAERLDRKRKSIKISYVDKVLWEREIKPSISIEEAAYDPYRKRLKVKHILVTTEKRTAEKALEMIQDVKKQLEGGKDFAELAKQYSEDPGTKTKGGELGWVDQSTPFVDSFKKAVFAGKKDEILGPVQTQYGYHLIVIEDEKTLDLEEVKKDKKLVEKLEKSRARDVAQKYMENLRTKYASQVHFFPERIRDPKKNADMIFLKVDDVDTLTVGKVAQMMGAQITKYQKDLGTLKDLFKKKVIDPDIRYLEGINKGYTKDEQLQKTLAFEMSRFKGQLYQNHVREQYEQKAKKEISEEEMKKHYEQNKNERYLTKDKKPIPFDKVKQWIEQDLVAEKTQSYMANLKSQLYKKYGVEFKG
jgi:hypothetical protein